MKTRLCPDCGDKMELGFIPDTTYGGVMQPRWHPETPEKSTFFGMKVSSYVVNVDPKKMIAVTTYRCNGCGLLRSYAETL